MKLPRDVTGGQLVKALRTLGYSQTRQSGSHIRVTTQQNGENHEVIPNASPIRVGTLSSILKSIAAHHEIEVERLIRDLEL